MKRIGPYRPITAFAPREQAASAALEAPPPSRSLVVVEPAVNFSQTNLPRRSAAAFVAQLLAAKDGVPQARERRRAEPEEALLAYTRGKPKQPSGHGKLLSRAL